MVASVQEGAGMSEKIKLWIETDKGRLYIHGDNAVEMIVPPGYEIHIEPGQKLPDLPPIEYDMSEEEAEEIRKDIAESIRIRLKMGKVGYGKE